MLASVQMRAVLAIARNRADVVVLSASALSTSADAAALAPLCDGIVLVVQQRSATRDHARRTRDLLDTSTTPGLGLVLDRADGRPRSPAGRVRSRGRAIAGRRPAVVAESAQASTASA
jgi:Mrp family chromosome partitioning ATPase